MSIPIDVTTREPLKIILKHDCLKARQSGSHVIVKCNGGRCMASIPVHAGKDLKLGFLKQIERDLEPCLGRNWARKGR